MSETAQAWCDRARSLLSLRKTAGDATGAGETATFDLASFRVRAAKAIRTWLAASEAVDGQIAALQSALLESDDPELQLIGELGLNAVTGNFRVPLMAALRGLGAATADNRADVVAATRKAIADFRRHLASSEEVAVVDDNPMGVPVRIVATLVPALDALDESLD